MPTPKIITTAKAVLKKTKRSPAKKAGKGVSRISSTPIPSQDIYAGVSDEAVTAKTGKHWSQWLSILDRKQTPSLTHKEMAIFLRENHQLSPWWSQMITVGYEQARGLRKKNETLKGYQVSASRTIALPVAELFTIWANEQEREWLVGQPLHVRSITLNKALRINWKTPASHVDVDFYPKNGSKTQIVISHTKLPGSKEVKEFRTFWKQTLNRIVVK